MPGIRRISTASAEAGAVETELSVEFRDTRRRVYHRGTAVRPVSPPPPLEYPPPAAPLLDPELLEPALLDPALLDPDDDEESEEGVAPDAPERGRVEVRCADAVD